MKAIVETKVAFFLFQYLSLLTFSQKLAADSHFMDSFNFVSFSCSIYHSEKGNLLQNFTDPAFHWRLTRELFLIVSARCLLPGVSIPVTILNQL